MRLSSRGVDNNNITFWGRSLVQGLAARSLSPFCAQAPAPVCWGRGGQIGSGRGLFLNQPPSLASTFHTGVWKEKDGKKQERKEPGLQFWLCHLAPL